MSNDSIYSFITPAQKAQIRDGVFITNTGFKVTIRPFLALPRVNITIDRGPASANDLRRTAEMFNALADALDAK